MRATKLLATLFFLISVLGCAEIYEAVSCSNNTSPTFISVSEGVLLQGCGPHERCQRVSLAHTDIWVKWDNQQSLILGLWGFYDKDKYQNRQISNIKLKVTDKSSQNSTFREYSSETWENGESVFVIDHKIKSNEIYTLTFELILETSSGTISTLFSGSLEKGSVRTCVPLV